MAPNLLDNHEIGIRHILVNNYGGLFMNISMIGQIFPASNYISNKNMP